MKLRTYLINLSRYYFKKKIKCVLFKIHIQYFIFLYIINRELIDKFIHFLMNIKSLYS